MECPNCGAETVGATCEYCGSGLDGEAGPPAEVHVAADDDDDHGSGRHDGGASGAVKVSGAIGVLILGGFCLVCGLGARFMGSQAASTGARVAQARVVAAEQAGDASGYVCVESTLPEVDAPVFPRIPERPPCLYYVQTRTEHEEDESRTRRDRDGRRRTTRASGRSETETIARERVSRFRLGALVVEPGQATFRGAETLHRTRRIEADGDDEIEMEWEGMRADQPVTVVGQASGGTMRGGDPFVVSTARGQADLVAQYEQSASFLGKLSLIALAIGVLGLVAGGVMFFTKK